MHTPDDPYAELGIPRDATQAEITHAFRGLLRRYHPDTRGAPDTASGADCDSALQRVLAAYSAIREPGSTRDRRPETAAPSVVSRQPGTDAPIRAGPIRWNTGIRRRPQPWP
jgi:hypothetical protein